MRRSSIAAISLVKTTGGFLVGLLVFCASPLKEKGPFWYNGYVYGTRAYSLYAEGNLDAAGAAYEKARAEARRLDIPRQAALYTFNIGRCRLEQGELDTALSCFVASYEEFVAAGDAPSAGRAAAFIALTYCEMGKADNAFIWYTKGTGGGTGDADKPLWLLVRGRIVWEREKGKEVLTWFEEAYQLQKKQKAFHAMAELCRLSAMVRVHFGQYADAKALIDEALDLSDRSGLRPGRAKILLAAGEIYKLAGDEQAGKRFLERAGECGGGKK